MPSALSARIFIRASSALVIRMFSVSSILTQCGGIPWTFSRPSTRSMKSLSVKLMAEKFTATPSPWLNTSRQMLSWRQTISNT
ncbi:hypothetical protein D9M69_255340 [compost metagenome]